MTMKTNKLHGMQNKPSWFPFFLVSIKGLLKKGITCD